MSGDLQRVLVVESLDNMRGGTQRVLVVGGDAGGGVPQYDIMPTAGADNNGKIVQYGGETDANYTQGYFYLCNGTTVASSASASQTVGSGLTDISVDVETLESFTGWTTDNSLQIFYTSDGWSVDVTSLGVTFTGTPSIGDAITITYTAAVTTYAWEQIDVQPAGSSLPSQTGHSGEFLTTDGTDASWAAVNALQNTATGTNSLTILGTPATTSYATNIGVNSSAGYEGVAIGTSASCSNAYVAIGYGAQASAYGIGIGKNVKANGNTCIGIGYLAEPTGNSAVSIGAMNKVTGAYSIQLGGIGFTNSEPGTFCVGLGNGGNYFPNYKLLDSDGTIPTARLTKVNITITLAAADWSGGSQTVTVTGVTSTSVVLVAPDPSDTADYVAAGILCTSQTTDSLTFTATTTPTSDIDVNIVCL